MTQIWKSKCCNADVKLGQYIGERISSYICMECGNRCAIKGNKRRKTKRKFKMPKRIWEP